MVDSAGNFSIQPIELPSQAAKQVVMSYGQTYHFNGWSIAAGQDGTRFTNDRTGHGMFVNYETVLSDVAGNTSPMSGDADNYEIAAAALGLLTATYHDGDHFGPVSFDYLSAMGTDTKKVIRIATGMTALARLLIGMRDEETGGAPEETLAELGRRIQGLFPAPE